MNPLNQPSDLLSMNPSSHNSQPPLGHIRVRDVSVCSWGEGFIYPWVKECIVDLNLFKPTIFGMAWDKSSSCPRNQTKGEMWSKMLYEKIENSGYQNYVGISTRGRIPSNVSLTISSLISDLRSLICQRCRLPHNIFLARKIQFCSGSRIRMSALRYIFIYYTKEH